MARGLVLLLRALALFVALQVSGLVEFVADVTASAAESSDGCCSDCPLEKSGRECPPGCPNCHCTHGGSALPPSCVTAFLDAFDPRAPMADEPVVAEAPRAPVLPGVFRPPRSVPAFV